MFGSKDFKKKNQKLTDQEKKTEMFFGSGENSSDSGYNFSVHTMEDDLVSSLNNTASVVREKDASNQEVSHLNKSDELSLEKNKEDVKLKSSPFLDKNTSLKADFSQNIMNNREIRGGDSLSGRDINREGVGNVETNHFLIKTRNDLSQKDAVMLDGGEEKSDETLSYDNGYSHPIEKHLNWKKVITISIVAVIFLAIFGGVYYLYITRKTEESQLSVENKIIDNEIASNISADDNFVYSSENPNYLNLDMETADNKSISKLLSDTFDNISVEQEDVAIEFILRDINNNPIAFSRFAYIFPLSLPEAALNEMDEEFSLFLIKNSNGKRMGLAVDVKDSNVAPFVLKENESNLVSALKSLFLGREIENTIGFIFKDGSYRDVKVRYTNINPANADSIDYAIWADKFLISTNKDSLRSIIDKIGAEKNSEQVVEVNSANISDENILDSSDQEDAGDLESDIAK